MQLENTKKIYLTRLLESEMVCNKGTIENTKSEPKDFNSFVCKSCGETWYVKNASEKKVKACPFCLKSIQEVPVEKEQIQDTRQIEITFSNLLEAKKKTTKEQDEQIFLLGKKLIWEKRYDEGIKFIRYAVAKGIKDACFFLGYCYEYGIGVRKDEKAAQGFYRNGTFSNKKFKEFHQSNKATYKDNQTILSMYAKKVVYETVDKKSQTVSTTGVLYSETQENIKKEI